MKLKMELAIFYYIWPPLGVVVVVIRTIKTRGFWRVQHEDRTHVRLKGFYFKIALSLDKISCLLLQRLHCWHGQTDFFFGSLL